MYSRFVPALIALTLSTIVVAAQTAPNMAAQPEVAAASPGAALAYLGTVSGGLNNTASGVAATVGGGFGNTESGYSLPSAVGLETLRLVLAALSQAQMR